MLNYSNLGAAPSCRQDPFGQEDPFGRIREENTPTEQPGTEVIGITYATIQRIMSQEKPDELLALYTFYAKETIRQRTQQVWCTTGFVCDGLGWGHEKVKRNKKRLIEMGLIENVKPKNRDGKFGKPYIRVRYLCQWSCLPTTGETRPQLLREGSESALRKNTQADASTPNSASSGRRFKERIQEVDTEHEARIINLYHRTLVDRPDSGFLPITKLTDGLKEILYVAAGWNDSYLKDVFSEEWYRWNKIRKARTLTRILWSHYDTDDDYEALKDF